VQEAKAMELKIAKQKAAEEAKSLLKALLRDGEITRDQFKEAAQAATQAVYRKLRWSKADMRLAVGAAVQKSAV
jgi:predicted RNA-binding protein associated with RNAse of E/G family